MRAGANERPTVGGHEECTACRRRFRVVDLEYPRSGAIASDIVALGQSGACDNHRDHNPYFNRCWSYWSDDRHSETNQRREPHAERAPDESPSPDETPWLEALDEAIAEVTCKEYRQLKRRHPNDITAHLERSFESIERLQTGGQPRYDQWDAPLYISWYQARQVHLVYAVLDQHPPPPSGKPLQIVDVGCGAWAVPIALAMHEARGHPALLDREVSVHGIEPASSMTRMGKELWLEFGCAAEARGLRIDFVEQLIDDDSIFTSVDAYPGPLARHASAESWLLAIHSLYDESQPEIRRFLLDYREQHASRLRYELLTTHKSKWKHIDDVGGSGEWIAPRPIWKGTLTETTNCRRRIRRELKNSGNPVSDKYMGYLENEVTWDPRNPGNPIEQDAIWLRRAGQ